MKFKLPLFFVIALLLQGVAQISLLNGAENKLNNSIKLHRDVISNASGSWQTVSLPYSYNSMVVICTVNYPSPDLNPVVRLSLNHPSPISKAVGMVSFVPI